MTYAKVLKLQVGRDFVFAWEGAMFDVGKAHPTVRLECRDFDVSSFGENAFWSAFKYRRDTEIFGEAEPADYVYQIISGAVRSFKLLPDGRRLIGAFHLPGDIFGTEIGDAYRFSAETTVNTKVWIAKRASIFGEPQGENGPSSGDVLRLVARSLHHAENHLLLLGRQTAVERVAAFLTEMDERLQSPRVLILPMTRRDIADYLGLTVETVSRAFSVLRSEKILSFLGQTQREVVLHRRSRLAQVAVLRLTS